MVVAEKGSGNFVAENVVSRQTNDDRLNSSLPSTSIPTIRDEIEARTKNLQSLPELRRFKELNYLAKESAKKGNLRLKYGL